MSIANKAIKGAAPKAVSTPAPSPVVVNINTLTIPNRGGDAIIIDLEPIAKACDSHDKTLVQLLAEQGIVIPNNGASKLNALPDIHWSINQQFNVDLYEASLKFNDGIAKAHTKREKALEKKRKANS